MIQHRSYKELEDRAEAQSAHCWQTTVLWLLSIAVYGVWVYFHTATHGTPVFDWLGFEFKVVVAALIGLVVKTWIDLRVKRYRSL